MNDYLKHYGVIGMKWGVRRYQNKDGTLTPKGKKRYESDVRANLSKKKDSRIDTSKPDPKRWSKEDTQRQKRVVDTGAGVVREARNLESDTRPKKAKQRMDLSKMSDQELRDRINREHLENQYNDLFAPDVSTKMTKGRDFVQKTLNIAGTTLAMTSSSLAIALAIKELKGY